MVWALLAMLGVPIWLIVGALGSALVSRRRFKAQPEVFRLKMRETGSEKWPRRVAYGRAVHDVLIVNVGLALVRTAIRGVQSVDDQSQDEPVPGFEAAAVFELRFDDGSVLQVAVDRSSASYISSLHNGGLS